MPLSHTLWGVWFGDTWRANPKLTVNYGVRWDFDYGIFSPAKVNSTSLMINDGRTTADYGVTAPNDDYTNLAPRVGFAYDVSGSGNMVIRGGSGLYFTQTANNVDTRFAPSLTHDAKNWRACS